MDPDENVTDAVKDLYASTVKGEGIGSKPHELGFDPIIQLKSVGYSKDELGSVPAGTAMGLGCSNPIPLAELREGEAVLDLGCGGGLDAFLAANIVGANGTVIGLDMTPEMVEKARENGRKGGYRNVDFRVGEFEHIPVDDNSVDVVISNCVMNHCPDKVTAFRDVFRVLRPGGRICIADLVVAGEFCEEAYRDELWGAWLTTALNREEYLAAIGHSGFRDIMVAAEGLFGMSETDERLAGKIISLQVTARKGAG